MLREPKLHGRLAKQIFKGYRNATTFRRVTFQNCQCFQIFIKTILFLFLNVVVVVSITS